MLNSATDPHNPPPLQSDYLGKWVSNARVLLGQRMSQKDYDAAMAVINRTANLAARDTRNGGRAALQSTAKQLRKLLRETDLQ